MSELDPFGAQLAAVLARELHGFKALLSCEQLTAGANHETFRVQVETDTGEQCFGPFVVSCFSTDRRK